MLGRFPGEGKCYPLQYSGLENSMDCLVHGVAKSSPGGGLAPPACLDPWGTRPGSLQPPRRTPPTPILVTENLTWVRSGRHMDVMGIRLVSDAVEILHQEVPLCGRRVSTGTSGEWWWGWWGPPFLQPLLSASPRVPQGPWPVPPAPSQPASLQLAQNPGTCFLVYPGRRLALSSRPCPLTHRVPASPHLLVLSSAPGSHSSTPHSLPNAI